ncbi:MAG: YifB family Mg chelatase-like AAA ATPase, partial [Solirubrobacterales bacterium]
DEIRAACELDHAAERALRDGHQRLGLSGRGWDRVARVARTIADLAGSEAVTDEHVAEALQLRRKPAS